jgi:hypothetical protein
MNPKRIADHVAVEKSNANDAAEIAMLEWCLERIALLEEVNRRACADQREQDDEIRFALSLLNDCGGVLQAMLAANKGEGER